MPKPTGILTNKAGDNYYPIPREISYSAPLPWSHVKVERATRNVELVALSAEDIDALHPVGFYHGRDEYYVISPETMMRQLQLVAKALAKHVFAHEAAR